MPEEKLMEENKEKELLSESDASEGSAPQVGEQSEKVEEKVEETIPEAETPAAAEPKGPEEQGLDEKAESRESEAEAAKEETRTFTQEQVNELVGKARAEGRKKGYEQAKAEALQRYNVDSDDELDSLFANGSRYSELSDRYKDSGNRLRDVQTELALVKSKIVPERQSDVKAILSANGLEVTEENIASLLPTHPEWTAQPQAQQQAPTQEREKQWQPQEPIEKLGTEPNRDKQPSEEEQREKAMKMFFGSN